ncbi:unnamed protein product [Moneuplotes crassus]|uniref:Macro domain-containing protein n=1 Tax=Euplotes crassus TaxID=5936 RepID=A0AAD2D8D5_EUPCR|nr:unnamed protein product [Moneuplotes crassus]
MDLKRELEKDFSDPKDLKKAIQKICERKGWRVEDMKNLNLTEDDIPKSLTRHIVWEKEQKKAIKEYQKCLESYQEFLDNFTLDGYKSDKLKDALDEARKRKEEFKAEVKQIKEKYPTKFQNLNEEEELKIMSDALENAEACTKKLEKIEEKKNEEMNNMITRYYETYETQKEEVDSSLKSFEGDLKKKTNELKGNLLKSTGQTFREFREIFKNLTSELAKVADQNAERELVAVQKIQESEILKGSNLVVNKDKETKEEKISFKIKPQVSLAEMLQQLYAENSDARRNPQFYIKIKKFLKDLKAKVKTIKKNASIECSKCKTTFIVEWSDTSSVIIDLISNHIEAREKLDEKTENYENYIIGAEDKFHSEIKNFKELKSELVSKHELNAEKINKDTLSKLSRNITKIQKISESLNEQLKIIENDKERQKDLISKINGFQNLISITQETLETYVECGNEIKEKSEKETKYSQALKEVKNYEQDIEYLKTNKENLDELIKGKSRPLRKKKIDKAEATDIYTFMYRKTRITVRKNDLVQEYVDAIVNPANEELNHAGGAARAIASKAGPEFERECEDYISENYKLKTGSSMVTSAGGELKCDYVIHTVGPIYEKNKKNHAKEFEQLKKCFESILQIMIARDFYDISIPAISTGIFGFPIKKCVEICASTIKNMINEDPDAFKEKEIILCNFDDKTTSVFQKCMKKCMNQESEDEDSDEERKDDYEDEESRKMNKNIEEDYFSDDNGALQDNRDEALCNNMDSDY